VGIGGARGASRPRSRRRGRRARGGARTLAPLRLAARRPAPRPGDGAALGPAPPHRGARCARGAEDPAGRRARARALGAADDRRRARRELGRAPRRLIARRPSPERRRSQIQSRDLGPSYYRRLRKPKKGRPQMRTKIYIGAIVAALCAVFAFSTVAGAQVKTATSVTIKYNGDGFNGKVKSSKSSCKKNRKVTVFKSNGQKQFSDTSSSDGSWDTGNSGQAHGNFFAKVSGTATCKGA